MDHIAQSTLVSSLQNYLFDLTQLLDSLLIYGESLAVIATIYIGLRFALIKNLKPLKVILGPLGMCKVHRIWLSIMVKRKNINSLRIFIERACIESQGEQQDRQWWKKRISEYSNNNTIFTIVIDNCFDLRKPGLNDVINSYFDYYRDDQQSIDAPLEFISDIRIREGYLAPMSFISGLQSRFGEDWSRILNNYTSTLIDSNELPIIPSELYFSYGWLMWGPSYQCDTNIKHNKQELILYGYGDEANSINVIVDPNNTPNMLWEKLNPSITDKTNFGFYCSITGRLVASTNYSSTYRNTLDEASVPFFYRMSHCEDTSFALKLSRYDNIYKHNTNCCFFSAYLWIMFSLDPTNFIPYRSLTFFEHANLPDVDNYEFLVDRLIDKVFDHFRTISKHDKYANRKYYYCLSFNSYVKHIYEQRLTSIKRQGDEPQFAQWINQNIAQANFSINMVLDSIDNYFKTNNFSRLSNKSDDLVALSEFYVNNYRKTKSHNNIWSFDTLVSIISSDNEKFKDYFVYSYWHHEETMIGYAVCHIDYTNQCAVIDYIYLPLTESSKSNHRDFTLLLVRNLDQLSAVQLNSNTNGIFTILIQDSSRLDNYELYSVPDHKHWYTNLESIPSSTNSSITKAIERCEIIASA